MALDQPIPLSQIGLQPLECLFPPRDPGKNTCWYLVKLLWVYGMRVH